MKSQQLIFKRKQLVIAMSIAMLGGVMSGCSSSSSSDDDSGSGSGSTPGTATIISNGGTGGMLAGGFGGEGGSVSLFNDGSSGGVEARTTGTVNTSFTTPTEVTDIASNTNLGTNPLAITADTTIPSYSIDSVANATGSFTAGDIYTGTDDLIRIVAVDGPADYVNDDDLAPGTAYLRTNENSPRSIYISDAGVTANHIKATGLSIASGATLTLGNNIGSGSYVSFVNDINNSGTITKLVTFNSNTLELRANKYVASGSVINRGTEDHENSGRVLIYANEGINNSGNINTRGFDEDNDVNGDEAGGNGGRIQLSATGYVLNSGTLDSSGGNGKAGGGDGDQVSIYAQFYTESTGDINTMGGNNISDPLVAGDGGDGGNIYIRANLITNNSANINASGGDGTNGGDAAKIEIYNNSLGQVINSGMLSSNGGQGLAGNGGDGDELQMTVRGGNLLNSGDLSAVGGDSADAAFNAGHGGEIEFYGYGGEANTEAGDILVTGNINISGGNVLPDINGDINGDGNGGYGGELSLDLELDNNQAISDQRVALIGYASIDANGGHGGEGGNASDDSISFYADYENDLTDTVFAGTAINDVPINARGGNSNAAAPANNDGGDGGEVFIRTSTSNDVNGLDVHAINTAAIDISGGNASPNFETALDANGGDGGEFMLTGYHGADNIGSVDNSAGDGGLYGGNGGIAMIRSESGEASNSGSIDSNGGFGGEFGRSGGFVYIDGNTASNSGAIGVNGGSTKVTIVDDVETVTPGTEGGDGGEVTIVGNGFNAATNTGSITYNFGTGETNGDEGCVQVGFTFEGNCSGGGMALK